MIEIKEKYDTLIFLCGDFNLVSDPKTDSIHRSQTAQECIVSNLVNENVRALQMIDCYRAMESKGGYTWNRGKCYSRLDMIFATDIIEHKIKETKVDWSFDNSDHALLEVIYTLPNSRKKGPGLPKVDATILVNEHIRIEVEQRLEESISQVPESWNPAEKWEFIKMSIRSVMWEIIAREKKVENIEVEALKAQVNSLKNNKATLSSDGKLTNVMEVQIEEDMRGLEEQLEAYRVKKSQALAFKARSKWFNEGEKSNKYFLNLLRKRNAENEMLSLSNGSLISTKIYILKTRV